MHVPLTYAVSIFLLWLGLSSQAWAKQAELPTTVFVFGSEAVFDFRLNHTLAVVQAALNIGAEKQAPIEVRSTAERELGMNRNRALASIQQNKGDVHIISSSASRDLDAMLMPIRISIASSMMGERIFLVRPERRREMESIHSLQDLQKHSIGVGQGWIDGEIMKHAGLRVQTSVRYDLLFPMLQGRRFDLLSRAVHEAWDELRTRGFRSLDWEGTWLLAYPVPFYLYVSKDQKELVLRLEKGLEALQANGTLDRLFVDHFGAAILRADWAGRRRIVIPNPLLPHQPPLHFSSWQQWHKKAEGDMARLQRMARDRFQPHWSGVYRPKLLIENQSRLPSPAKHKAKSPPLIVRSADRPNDTHILAAVFAFELALSQPVNQQSPYFQKGVHYLIDKDLDQETALLALRNQSPFVDAVATQSSHVRENRLLTARVDISQGMMGHRVFVIRKQNEAKFNDVQTIDDLRRFNICVGSGWPDRLVMEAAGIPVVTRTFTRELYQDLHSGRCDGVSHTIYEARDEILARPLEGLEVEPNLLLSYPAKQQMFFSKSKSELAYAAERGLLSLQNHGILQELLEVIYGDSIQYVQLSKRRVLTLSNPNLAERISLEKLNAPPMIWF